MSKGKYIVIEGHDGVGKSTQVDLLAKHFREGGQEVVQVNEPGGLLSGDLMRILVKNKEFGLDGISNLLIFTANRRELWEKIIAPALKAGKIVICDRNWWSTVVYQHFGQGVKRELIEEIVTNCLPERYVKPDYGCIMALDEKERLKRLKHRLGTANKDAFESQADEFQTRVAAGYEEIAELYKIPVIDASPVPEVIHKNLLLGLGAKDL